MRAWERGVHLEGIPLVAHPGLDPEGPRPDEQPLQHSVDDLSRAEGYDDVEGLHGGQYPRQEGEDEEEKLTGI